MRDPAIRTNGDYDAAQFLRDSGELQRITVRCLVVALRQRLAAEGFVVGAVWHEEHRVLRFRAVLPYRLLWRNWFHLALGFRLLIERINDCVSVHHMKIHKYGPYIDFTTEVEAST